MSGGGRYPRWRVLVDGDVVAVDRDGAIASVVTGLGGFPLSPELLLDLDGPLGLEVREWSPDLASQPCAAHQASRAARASSSLIGPSSRRSSSRNRYAAPTVGPGAMPRISMIWVPSRSGRI